MQWALPPILEHHEARNVTRPVPRTPYPFDPVRDSVEASSASGSALNASSAMSSYPEKLALSPETADRYSTASGDSGSDDSCDEDSWSEGESADSSEPESLACSLWEPESMCKSPAGLGPAIRMSPADESTVLIKRGSDDDMLSDTSLEGMEAAAVDYLMSGGNSYSRAGDAERRSTQGTLYKVVWRDSWVSQSRMPDMEPVRRAHVARYGTAWAVETIDEDLY
ncbi:hypothetical protein LTR53_005111 [Teratosphaeriaceae sp. CCFEE 6253]|nr:hypothetical protein LTR53_005111 [Teratosphaeriaceae sp. CCFEE 6253]